MSITMRRNSELMQQGHQNFVTFFRLMALCGPGGAAQEVDGLNLIGSGLPLAPVNLAIAMNISRDPAGALASARTFYADHGGEWTLYADGRAAEAIALIATDSGMEAGPREPGMLLDALPDVLSPDPPELTVRVVDDADLFTGFVTAFATAFDAPDTLVATWWAPLLQNVSGLTGYVGFVNGQPVATVARYSGHRIAGIFGVGTVPEFRQRGLASALVRRATFDGRRDGCLASYLQAWELGTGVYARLGFRPVTQYQTWHPSA